MSNSPWRQGQTSPTWLVSLKRDTTVFDLTGQQASYISFLIYNQAQSSVVATGTGQVTIIQNNPAQITYAPNASDSSGLAPGVYYTRYEVLFNGISPDYSDFLPWVIQA